MRLEEGAIRRAVAPYRNLANITTPFTPSPGFSLFLIGRLET